MMLHHQHLIITYIFRNLKVNVSFLTVATIIMVKMVFTAQKVKKEAA